MDTNKFKNIISKITNFTFLDGKSYVEYIENIQNTDRKWYQVAYLYYYKNFEIIIISVSLILLGLIIYETYFTNNSNNNITKCDNIKYISITKQKGGATQEEKAERKAAKKLAKATKTREKKAAKEAAKAQKASVEGSSTKKGDKLLTSGAKRRLSSIKAAPSAAIKGAKAKGSAALKSVTSGEARKKAGKFAKQGLNVAADRIKGSSDIFYKIVFTVFLTAGFGIFIFPTLVMIIIGFLTFIIIRKHIISTITL